MAMNRGEDLKLLSVKVVLPTNIKDNFNWVCRQVLRKTCKNSHWRSLFDLVVADCFDRLVKPAIINRTKYVIRLYSKLFLMLTKQNISVFQG